MPAGLTLFATVHNPRQGLALQAFAITVLVAQTGFQLDFGRIRTSALELLVLVLLPLLLILAKTHGRFPYQPLPHARWLLLFAVWSAAFVPIGYLQQASWSAILPQLKGFLLYPMLALVILNGVRSAARLRQLSTLLLGWYVAIATLAIFQYLQALATHRTPDSIAFRASADYAPINVFGITLCAMSLYAAGIAAHTVTGQRRLLLSAASLWLLIGSLTSVSRTVLVAYVAGYLTLLLLMRSRRTLGLILLLFIPILAFLLFPHDAMARLSQLTDSSSLKRLYYLQSALSSWQASPLFGHGWGRAFWLSEAGTLIPSNSYPWYHNDYLNLAVQVGAIGLLLYLTYWWRIFASAIGALGSGMAGSAQGHLLGSVAALAAMLVAALFEHVLWRPDIAGLLGWLLGILFVSIQLGSNCESNQIQ